MTLRGRRGPWLTHLLVLVGVGLTSCGMVNQVQTPSPSAPALTDAEICNAQSWPRPVPAVDGQILAQALRGSLACFNVTAATAPDGHDVRQSPSGDVTAWRITSISPASGRPIGKTDPVTLRTVAVDPSEPKSADRHPCDWVTAGVAEKLLGEPVGLRTEGDDAGSVDWSCDYSSANHRVTSELMLPGSFPVDAKTEFAAATARADSTELSGAGLPNSCGSTGVAYQVVVSRLVVLLDGGRLYVATGWRRESCAVLGQFAELAIPRINA